MNSFQLINDNSPLLKVLTIVKELPKVSAGPADKLKLWATRNWQSLKFSNNRDGLNIFN